MAGTWLLYKTLQLFVVLTCLAFYSIGIDDFQLKDILKKHGLEQNKIELILQTLCTSDVHTSVDKATSRDLPTQVDSYKTSADENSNRNQVVSHKTLSDENSNKNQGHNNVPAQEQIPIDNNAANTPKQQPVAKTSVKVLNYNLPVQPAYLPPIPSSSEASFKKFIPRKIWYCQIFLIMWNTQHF